MDSGMFVLFLSMIGLLTTVFFLPQILLMLELWAVYREKRVEEE